MSKFGTPVNFEQILEYFEDADKLSDSIFCALICEKNAGWFRNLFSLRAQVPCNTLHVALRIVMNAQLPNLFFFQVGCSECIVVGRVDILHLKRVFNKCDIRYRHKPNTSGDDSWSINSILKVLNPRDHNDVKLELKNNYLLRQASYRLIEPPTPDNCTPYRYKKILLEDYVTLNVGTVKACCLGVGAGLEKDRRKPTLFSILDVCKTSSGRNMLKRWLLKPLRSAALIQRRLNTVDFFSNRPTLCGALRDGSISQASCVEKLSNRLRSKHASLDDIIKLYKFTLAVKDLASALPQGESNPNMPIRGSHFEELFHALQGFVKLVEESVEVDSSTDGFTPFSKLLRE